VRVGVLPSVVVRVGFLTHLLWERYGPFWTSLAQAGGAEVVHPEVEAVVARLADPRVAAAPAIAFRVAIASALALEEVDLLVVPRLNPAAGDRGGRGAGQDPWVAELPTMLERSVPGLPPIWSVEADLGRPLESNAVTFLRRLTTDVGVVRRAWSQHRAAAHPPRRGTAAPMAAPPGTPTVALVGEPWWMTPAVAALATRPGERLSAPYDLDPAALRDEGRRLDVALVDSDAEALGAIRLYARSAAIARLRLVVDAAADSDAWLVRRARVLVPRRLEVVDVRDLGGPEQLLQALLRPRA